MSKNNEMTHKEVLVLFTRGSAKVGYWYRCRECKAKCKDLSEARDHYTDGCYPSNTNNTEITNNTLPSEDRVIVLDPEKWVLWASDLVTERNILREDAKELHELIEKQATTITQLNEELQALTRTQKEVKIHNEQAEAYQEYNER